MTRARAATLAAVAALAVVLYLLPIPERGLVGPDEPRYASIARKMAETGDWITPRLWGGAWFEKPAMLFWMGAVGYSAGLEAYTRVPVALLSLGFLAFFFWRVREHFDSETAITATCLLATSAGWIAYSDAGVFDAPLTVFTSGAMLCLLPWARSGVPDRPGEAAAFGALLGCGVLSKGLVALLVAASAATPVLFRQPRALLELLRPRALGMFALTCLPWYAACYWANGRPFVEEFIIRHHFERFVSASLQHVQPWWFYVPVLAAFLLPWTPLALALRWETLAGGPCRRFLACWALGPLLLFSASVNKLPAYILPALPPLAILLAIQWKAKPNRPLLFASGATLLLAPLAGALLPPALADGIRRAWAGLDPASMAGAAVAGLAAFGLASIAALRASRQRSIPAVCVIAALALAALKFQAFPSISVQAGTREFVAGEPTRLQDACLGDVRRHAAYGIRHYSRDSVPSCGQAPATFRIEGDPPGIAAVPSDLCGACDKIP
ncbi:MAG: phospholipid carrier-dependent glycosyltransferase [Bryobacterales bacterium]|nr:phospholipid carrier-dependent glycosyltransferase [Bryobacterales bacterium]